MIHHFFKRFSYLSREILSLSVASSENTKFKSFRFQLTSELLKISLTLEAKFKDIVA